MRAFALVLMMCASIVLGQSEKQAAEQTQPAQQPCTDPCRNQQASPLPPISITVSPTQTLQGHPKKEIDGVDDKSGWEMWTAIGTGILAIGTLLLAGIAIRQRYDLADTAEKQLRAYLGVGDGEVFPLPNRKLRGVVEIRNFGHTPAHKVRIAVTGELRREGDNRPFPDPEFIPHTHPIAPTMGWTVGHEFGDMTEDDLQDVLKDRLSVYIWGRASYQDIYGKPHTLGFRFRNVVKVFSPTETGIVMHRWKYYPENEGNYAD